MLTPDVEYALQWFAYTHSLQSDGWSVSWRRTGLPSSGAVGDQDARLMQQLDALLVVENEILREHQARTKARDDARERDEEMSE